MVQSKKATVSGQPKGLIWILTSTAAIADWIAITAFIASMLKQNALLIFFMTVAAIVFAVVVYFLSPRIGIRGALIASIGSLVLAIIAWSLLASSGVTSLKVNITDPQDDGNVTRLSGPYLAKGTVSDPNARVYVIVRTLPMPDSWVQQPAIVGGGGNWQTPVYFGDATPKIGEKYEVIALATNDNFLVTWATGNSFSENQRLLSLPRKSNKSSLITVTRSD